MKRSVLSLALALIAGFGLVLAGSFDASACDTCGCQAKADTKAAKAPKVFDKAPAVGTKATCPVMGGEFVVAKDSKRSTHNGKHVVFCCDACKPKFDAKPAKYL